MDSSVVRVGVGFRARQLEMSDRQGRQASDAMFHVQLWLRHPLLDVLKPRNINHDTNLDHGRLTIA